MKRNRFLFPVLLVVAFSLIMAGMTISAGKALFGEPPNLGAAYRGSESCLTCHNEDSAMLWDAWSQTAHAWTVRPVSDETMLGDLSIAPVFPWMDGEERTLSSADITYVVGGRYTQRYISIREREDGEMGYFVLPVIWNVPLNEEQVGEWTVLDGEWTTPETDWRMTCAGCHTTGSNSDVVSYGANIVFVGEWQSGDVEIGIGCEACHGPGGDHNAGENPMPRTPDAQTCGQCHAQGLDASGNHPFPLDYQPGLPLDESFVINGPDNEATWWASGHTKATANQYGEWINSAHSTALETMQSSDLAEDFCVRCHATAPDSTDPTPDMPHTLDTAAFGVTCMTCHNLHPSESQPRAFYDLPGQQGDEEKQPATMMNTIGGKVTLSVGEYLGQPIPDSMRFLLQDEPDELCLSCHNSQTVEGDLMLVGETVHHPVQEMFTGMTVIAAVEGEISTHASSDYGPRCVTCHMPRTAEISAFAVSASHLMTPLMPIEAEEGQTGTCTDCHTELAASDLQHLINDTQDVVLERLTITKARVANIDLPEAGTPERDVYDQALLALNFVQNDGSLGVHNYPYAEALLDFAETTISELNVAQAGADTEPTAAPAPTAEGERFETVVEGVELTSAHGWRPITFIVMGLTLLLLASAGFIFFRSSKKEEVDA